MHCPVGVNNEFCGKFKTNMAFLFPLHVFTNMYCMLSHAFNRDKVVPIRKKTYDISIQKNNTSPVCSKKDICPQIVVPVDPIRAGLLHLENSCSSFSLWLRDCY